MTLTDLEDFTVKAGGFDFEFIGIERYVVDPAPPQPSIIFCQPKYRKMSFSDL